MWMAAALALMCAGPFVLPGSSWAVKGVALVGAVLFAGGVLAAMRLRVCVADSAVHLRRLWRTRRLASEEWRIVGVRQFGLIGHQRMVEIRSVRGRRENIPLIWFSDIDQVSLVSDLARCFEHE